MMAMNWWSYHKPDISTCGVVRGKPTFGCLLFASREVQGYKRVWSSTLRGLLQVKRNGTGRRISVTFLALHLKTCPVQWHPVWGRGRLAQSQGLGSACAISSQFSEWTSCHCWASGHTDPLYLLPRCCVCFGTMWAWCMWPAAKGKDCLSLALSTFSLPSSAWLFGLLTVIRVWSVISKLTDTLLGSHSLCDTVELPNLFWESLHLHPVFSEYSISDRFFPIFLITRENLAASIVMSVGS